MKIQLQSSILSDVLSLHSRVIGSPHISIKAEDGCLHVTSTNKGSTLYRRISDDIEVIEDGEFTTDPEHFAGLLSGRRNVTITLDDETVLIKSGKYNANVAILPYEDISVEQPDDGEELNFETAEVDVLISLCKAAQLTSPTLDGGNLPLIVRIDEKGTQVACMDNFHVSLLQSKELVRDTPVETLLPSGLLPSLQAAAQEGTYSIQLASNQVFAQGESFMYSTPTEQIASRLNLGHVASLKNTIKKGSKDSTVIELQLADLQTALQNVFSVAEARIPVTLETKSRKGAHTLLVGTKSSFGSAFDELPATVTGDAIEANFTSYLLGEIIDKVRSETVTLNVLPNLLHMSESYGAVRSLLILLRN